ncbi:MAG: hypothetical protein FWG10_13900 [Eubacteriaceae bacterium]|nr:hypothetical protein [Eubacteriaceae bacterium]
MDEKPIQLFGETQGRIGAKPLSLGPETGIVHRGCPEVVDYEYTRKVVASIFIFGMEACRG